MKLLTISSSLLLLLASFGSQAELAVIAHPSMGDALTQKQISRIFLGKSKKFPSAGIATPIDLPDTNTTKLAFNKDVLKKSPQQMKSFWSKQIFTGKGKPPRQEDNAAAIIALVKANPNMIAYVDASAVTGDVKVVATF